MPFDFTPQKLFVVRHLRFQRLWIGLGILMVLTVTVASVIALPPPINKVMVHDKLLHTLAYACMMGWFAQIFRHDLTRLVLVVGLVSLGIGIEFIQGTTAYRQFDLLDMIANTSGVVLAWALAYTWVGNILCWTEECFCKVLQRA